MAREVELALALRRTAAGAVLVAGLLAAPSTGADEPWIGWDLRCDSQQVRVADPDHAGLVVDGLAAAGNDGERAVEDRAAVLLLLGEPRPETVIYLEARSDGKRLQVNATLNERQLGGLEFRRRREIRGWPVPAGAARRGVNVLRLEPAPSRSRDAPRLLVSRVGVGPRRCRGGEPRAIPVDGGAPLTLSDRSLVLVPLARDPSNGDGKQLEISFSPRGRTAVSVSCWTASGVHPLALLRGGANRRTHAFVPLGAECADARGLALAGVGPGTASGLRASIDSGSGRSWRKSIRRQSILVVALCGLLGIGAAVALRRRGRLAPGPDPGDPAAPVGARPWLDAGCVFLLALVARGVFYLFYPRPGEAGDSYEYLLRAGFLASGKADFWRDLEWHSWGTFIRPPGYFALLALLDGPSAAGRMMVVWLQLVLSAATAGATYLVAFPLFGRLAAWCAGLLFAGYLGSIATYSRILAEPLFMFLALAGLAGVAWLGARPGWRLGLAAGALFGLAALVRPGPTYYPPLAGLLLIPALGWRRGSRAAAALVLGLAAVVLPWSLRNTLVAGVPLGVETVSVANLLLTYPDERVVPVAGLDLQRPEDYTRYRQQIHRVGSSPLTRSKGPHVRRILAEAARHPAAHLRRVGHNLRGLLGPVPDEWLRWILAEADAPRVARLTSLLNAQFGLLLILGGAGLALFLRRPRCWPVAAWLFFNVSTLTFFFYSVTRYREPSTPVLMVFAGGAAALVVERLAALGKGRRAAGPVVEMEAS